MLSKALHELQSDPAKWERCRGLFKVLKIPAKTSLLREGEVAHSMYFVKEGCLRLWFNKDGKDVTFQFFLEGQAVASMESFLGGRPSLFSLESIEPTTAAVIGREGWDRINEAYPNLRDFFMQIVLQRMENYGRLFLSRIKDSPRERYEELLREHLEIVRRIPQHYIASYLGITPVSLEHRHFKRHFSFSKIASAETADNRSCVNCIHLHAQGIPIPSERTPNHALEKHHCSSAVGRTFSAV
jgi:CRP-like cAMP-binding protein